MNVLRMGFLSGFNHVDCELAIVRNTASPGRKSSGDVKKKLRNKLLNILDVGTLAKGEGGEVSGFSCALASSTVLLRAGGSTAKPVLAVDCGLICVESCRVNIDDMLGQCLGSETNRPLAILLSNYVCQPGQAISHGGMI